MQSISHQKPQSAGLSSKWLRWAGTTGFAFFLAKGLAWIIVAVWAFYED